MKDINWEYVTQEAFTSIRRDFLLYTLIELEQHHDNPTPVSGDMIAQIRGGVR